MAMPMHRFRRARSTRNALWLSVLCCFLLSTDLIVTVQARFIIDTSLSTSTLLPQQQQLLLPKLYTCCFNKFPVARSKRTYRCHNNIISTSSVLCDPVWNQNHRQLCIRGGATDTVDAGIDKKEETANPPPRPTLVASDLMAKARQELAASKARVSSIVAKDSQQQQQQQQSTSNQHNLWPSSLHATTTAASALSSSSSSSSSLTPLWTVCRGNWFTCPHGRPHKSTPHRTGAGNTVVECSIGRLLVVEGIQGLARLACTHEGSATTTRVTQKSQASDTAFVGDVFGNLCLSQLACDTGSAKLPTAQAGDTSNVHDRAPIWWIAVGKYCRLAKVDVQTTKSTRLVSPGVVAIFNASQLFGRRVVLVGYRVEWIDMAPTTK
eukprot:scaffold795_cov187-Amphora_coffeaeformis.AAC.29